MKPRFTLSQTRRSRPATRGSLGDSHPEPWLVIVQEAALECILRHAKEDPETEVLGLLAGRVEVEEGTGRFRIHLTHAFPAPASHSNRVRVEVSAEILAELHGAFEAARDLEPELLKVGWYHTHPGHGIFMSGVDVASHAMFSEDWHVALVADPINDVLGVFHTPDCQPIPVIVEGAAIGPRQQYRFSWPLVSRVLPHEDVRFTVGRAIGRWRAELARLSTDKEAVRDKEAMREAVARLQRETTSANPASLSFERMRQLLWETYQRWGGMGR